MTYVFDTSSLMAVLLDQDSPGLDVLFDEHTLKLTFYEAGNVVWKATHLQDRIASDEAQRLLKLLEDLRLELVVEDLSELGMETVFRTAAECEVTFYDAAHVSCAEAVDATLVTEDSELRAGAEERVSVCGLEGIA